jgi:hypothetical protein
MNRAPTKPRFVGANLVFALPSRCVLETFRWNPISETLSSTVFSDLENLRLRWCSRDETKSTADVNQRATFRVGFSLPQNLVGQRRDIALAGEQKSRGVVKRPSFRPLEVHVW